jgi:hypothetical protein
MSQGGGMTGAGNLLYPCVGDVAGHVLCAGGEDPRGVRTLQHHHPSQDGGEHARIRSGVSVLL